jgi:crotonobetainyl-CoA:carnitine CoA-transferase CaiB-like acyl-CoA transferase
MEKPELDELQQNYKQAVDAWVAAIRAEEALANSDHSEVAMEKWDRADFAVQDAEKQAREARDQYKDALRLLHYGI